MLCISIILLNQCYIPFLLKENGQIEHYWYYVNFTNIVIEAGNTGAVQMSFGVK